MLKKMLCSVALAACALNAHAADVTVDWQYQGLFDVQENAFHPEMVIKGTFVADDINHDGAFSQSELKSFTFWASRGDTCGFYTPEHACQLTAFSYQPGGDVTFSGWSSFDYNQTQDRIISTIQFTSPLEYRYDLYEINWNISHTGYYKWSPETVFTVTPVVLTPVPEPQTALMLGVGLLGLIGAARRRRKGA